jgi:thiol-disulfide isomerase/thioredoxin
MQNDQKSRKCPSTKTKKILAVAVVAFAIGVSLTGLAKDITMSQSTAPRSEHLAFLHRLFASPAPSQYQLASLKRANEWLNSSPLADEELRGKVVLVEFWTYTCINWLRQLPFVRAWAEKYKDHGLVVIGVHTPEFPFEKDLDNVRPTLKTRGITYPVAIDNDYEIWRSFSNNYWPALYFFDAQGRLRHSHFGEGQYEHSEMIIQRLLIEAGNAGLGDELVSVDAPGVEAAADWSSLKSPENYLGYERTENFASASAALLDRQRGLASEKWRVFS